MTNGGMMYSKGDIVIIEFPFSDLTNTKKRPMIILAEKGEDIIGCAITSNPESGGILLDHFEEGNLPLQSWIKYWQVHTFLKSFVIRKVAKISKKSHKELIGKINELFER